MRSINLPRTGGQWSEVLRDRSHVLIRPYRSADLASWPNLLTDAGQACRHLSFTGRISSRTVPVGAEEKAAADPQVYAILLREGTQEKLVGMGKFQLKDRGLGCECTIAVLVTRPDRELDALLMRHLIGIARSQGMRDLTSIASAVDTHSTDLLHHLGFRATYDPADPDKLIHELSS